MYLICKKVEFHETFYHFKWRPWKTLLVELSVLIATARSHLFAAQQNMAWHGKNP